MPVPIPGKPLLIGHLDTGISSSQAWLIERTAKFFALDQTGGLCRSDQVYDRAGHGTHTAGIIFADAYNGLPRLHPDTKLCAVSLSENGKILLNLLTGMDLLLDCDIHILCMPVGVLQRTPLFQPLIRASLDRGILVIAPVGNKGKGNADSPGFYPGVLSVGAVDENGNVAGFSGSFHDEAGHCLKPDIMAPGVNILSAAPGGKTRKRSGTSMACAYIAGAAARLWQAKPNASAHDIKKALLNTALSLRPHQKHRCRTGIAQPKAALDDLLKAPPGIPANGRGEPWGHPDAVLHTSAVPPFLTQPFIDQRFFNMYKRAKPDSLLESIIIPKKHGRKTLPGMELIRRVQEKTGAEPQIIRHFKYADLLHIKGQRSFFQGLLEHPDLWVCSAVDISVFDF